MKITYKTKKRTVQVGGKSYGSSDPIGNIRWTEDI